MAVEVAMPKFGLTMHDGTVQRYFKAVGQQVAAGEPSKPVERGFPLSRRLHQRVRGEFGLALDDGGGARLLALARGQFVVGRRPRRCVGQSMQARRDPLGQCPQPEFFGALEAGPEPSDRGLPSTYSA